MHSIIGQITQPNRKLLILPSPVLYLLRLPFFTAAAAMAALIPTWKTVSESKLDTESTAGDASRRALEASRAGLIAVDATLRALVATWEGKSVSQIALYFRISKKNMR